MDTTQNIISFCTGYGGLELGLRLAGVDVRTVAACEIEAYAVANLVAKMEAGTLEPFPVWPDLKTFPAAAFSGRVHGILAGYPCQPFSCAGKRQGADDPRHLWPYILEHIRTIRPVWCFFENVAGHLNLGFEEVFKSLRDLGYAVEAGLFTAAEVGAPHKRQRLFILAVSDELKGRPHAERRISDPEVRSASKGKLEDPQNTNRRTGKQGQQGPTGQRRNRSADTGEQLAYATQQRIQGNRTKGQQESQAHAGQTLSVCGCGRWPARSGQEQYDWEEPRTVKSGMGRTVNGIASRVDELRLLGNGVVPQQAAKAWITLWGKLIKRRPDNFEC